MSLNHVEADIIRQEQGFVFYMEVKATKQMVRVFVSNEALIGSNNDDNTDLLSQFEMERSEIEAIACEKYNRGRVSASGLIVIGLSDIAGMIS